MKVSLNDEQAMAAGHLAGPVLVTAGAGTGKTRMLTERFANAVVPDRLAGWKPVEPGSVVAITYTEKAAAEIAERVKTEIAGSDGCSRSGSDDLWISTIHRFCARILRRNPLEAGIDPLFSVADILETGRLRESAFRDALSQLDSEDGRLRGLLDSYGVDAVFAATLEIVRQLAMSGLGAEAIRVETVPSLSDLLAEADALFSDGTSTGEIGYTGTSNGHIEHAEQCHYLRVECSGLALLDHSDTGKAERVLEMAEGYTPLKKLKGFEELNAEYVARKSMLAARAAGVVALPHLMTLSELVGAYSNRYRELKEQAGELDFEDLQTKTVELLERWPEVESRYRERFKVVMIDEFQDTDALQLALVERIAGANLCTVGDEMQAIYGFRGADVEVYREHRELMRQSGALVAELATNYRSHPDILGFVNRVFGSQQYAMNHTLPLRPVAGGRGTQRLDTAFDGRHRVEVLFVDAGDEGKTAARRSEAAEIARSIAELRAHGVQPGDVAVLLRAYTDAHVYANALAVEGIPAVVVGGGRFFDLAETAIMRSLTRVIANVADEAALAVLLASDFVPVADEALLSLRLESQDSGRSLWETVRAASESLDSADMQALVRLREVIENGRARIGREPLADVLLRAVEEAGYDLRLLARGNTGRDAFANVLKFARRAAEFELRDGSGPAGFSEHLDAKVRLNDRESPDIAVDEGASSVQIMSIHAAKGLEFPVVVVPDIGRSGRGTNSIVRTGRGTDELRVALKTPPGSGDGKPRPNPEWFCSLSEAERAAQAGEDDRLLYVALTRAREFLMVSGSARLNPVGRPTGSDDLLKLVRVLGHDVPIGDVRDEEFALWGDAVGHLRILGPEASFSVAPAKGGDRLDAPPPAIGDPLNPERTRPWLPDSVSYTQLSEFERCPRQFHVRRVLGVAPRGVDQVRKSQPKRLGTALHVALQLVSPAGEEPPEERMQAVAQYFELDSDDTRRLAEATVRYCRSDVARRAVGAERMMREAPFHVDVGPGLFVMAGSMDLYGRSGDIALIVDYKSGTSGSPEELSVRYRLQADCYAFAALCDGAKHVEVVFVRPESPVMEQASFAFEAQDARRIEAELVTRYREIEQSEFAPAPGDVCTTCEVPLGLCEYRAASGLVGGRRR